MNTSPAIDLDDLRREIDDIDERLHDLLMQRAEVVLRIAAAKRHDGSPTVRPAREADILRRLISRHRGALDPAALARLWREMMVAMTSIQSPLAVAMYAPDVEREQWDLARGHFGGAELFLYDSSPQVLRAVCDGGTNVLGLLPLPQGGELSAWWPALVSVDAFRPRIVARLPFVRGGSVLPQVEAMVVAPFEAGDSGDDISLVVLITIREVSRGRLIDWLAAAGLAARPVDARQLGGADGDTFHLIEIAGYVTDQDARLSAVAQASDGAIARVAVIGAYARPLDL